MERICVCVSMCPCICCWLICCPFSQYIFDARSQFVYQTANPLKYIYLYIYIHMYICNFWVFTFGILWADVSFLYSILATYSRNCKMHVKISAIGTTWNRSQIINEMSKHFRSKDYSHEQRPEIERNNTKASIHSQ